MIVCKLVGNLRGKGGEGRGRKGKEGEGREGKRGYKWYHDGIKVTWPKTLCYFIQVFRVFKRDTCERAGAFLVLNIAQCFLA